MYLLITDLAATFLEACLLYYLMKRERFSVFGFVISVSVFLFFVLWLTSLSFPLDQKFLINLFFLTVSGIIIHKQSFYRALLMSLFFYMFITLGEIAIQILLLLFTGKSVVDAMQNMIVYIGAIFFSKVISAFFVVLGKRSFEKMQLIFDYKFSIFILVLLSFMILLITKLENMILGYATNFIIWNDILFSCIAFFSSLCLVLVFRYVLIIKDIQIAKNWDEQQLARIFDYYQKRQIHDQINRRVYHDIRSHLMILESMESGDKKRSYLSKMKSELKNLEYNNSTGNEILDLLIWDKKEKDVQVSVICDGDISSLNFLDCFDLVTIFGNALDNAFEALENVRDEEKIIEIKIKTIHHFLMIEFGNMYEGKDVNYTKTSKDEKELHGLGITNIIEAVKKYDGQISIKNSECHFIVQILIPM